MIYKLRYKNIASQEQVVDITPKVLASQLPLAEVAAENEVNKVRGVISVLDADKNIEKLFWTDAKYSAVYLEVYTDSGQLLDVYTLTGKYSRRNTYFLDLEYTTYTQYTPTPELQIAYGEVNYITSLKQNTSWVPFSINIGTSRKISFWWGVKADEDIGPHEITYATIGSYTYALFRNVLVKFNNTQQPYQVEKIVYLRDLVDSDEDTIVDILLPSKNLQTPKTLRAWIVDANSTTIQILVNTAKSREGGSPSVNCFAVWYFNTNLSVQSKTKFLFTQENFSSDVCYYSFLGAGRINGVQYFYILEKNPTNAKLIWGNTSSRYTNAITYFSNNITKLTSQAVCIDRGSYADVLIPAPRSLWLRTYSSGSVTTVATTDIIVSDEKESYWRCYFDADYSRLYYIAHRITSTNERYEHGYFSINFGGNSWSRVGVRSTTSTIYGYGFDSYTKQDVYLLRDRVVVGGTTSYFAHYLYHTRYIALTSTTPILCLYAHPKMQHVGVATISSAFYYSCDVSSSPSDILQATQLGYIHAGMLRPFPSPDPAIVITPDMYTLLEDTRNTEKYLRLITQSIDGCVCASTPAFFVASDVVVQLATYAECADYISRIYMYFYNTKYIIFESQNNYTGYISQCIAITDTTSITWYAVLLAYSYTTANTYTYVALAFAFEEGER